MVRASDTNGERRHFAIIPARGGSKSFPLKNQYFFNFNADFLEGSRLFDEILVTSDDETILSWAVKRGHFARRRPSEISGDKANIKESIVDLIENAPQVRPEDYLWLTYNTQLHKNVDDFRAARQILDEQHPPAFCTFIDVETHPYITWYPDSETGKMRQFIPNDIANRQEMPPAWMNYMHITGFQAQTVERLNNNLLGEDTYPIFLPKEKRDQLCDLDQPEDILAWKRKHPEEYELWLRTLPSEIDLTALAPLLEETE